MESNLDLEPISLPPDGQHNACVSPFARDFKDLSRGDIPIAGGKGANLGELTRAGFPVPPGFVVLTAAFDCFIETNKLEAVIARDLGGENADASAIRSAIESSPVPHDIEQALWAAYRSLARGKVAVRSSATAEDLPEAAFAGQQDTFLNIEGYDALLVAVRKCWASLWSDRAIAYRQRQGIDESKVKMAVAVQCMVEAKAAGVLFTVNPVSGARDEMTIEAAPGLGEAVVSGQVTPEGYVLKQWWRSRRIVSRPPRRAARTAAVPDETIKDLAELGASIESHFGSPQDIEWAWAAGRLYIVQARPMTAVPDPPLEVAWWDRIAAGILAEFLPWRPYPLEMTTWTPAPFDAMAGMVRWFGVRLPRFRDLFDIEDAVVARYRGLIGLRPSPAIILAPFRLISLAWRYDPVRWCEDPLFEEAQARPKALASRDIPALDWSELVAMVRQSTSIISSTLGELRRRYAPRAAMAIVTLKVLTFFLGHHRHFAALLSGVQTKTLETNRALEVLASRVRSDTRLAAVFTASEPAELTDKISAFPDFSSEFRTFLERYGHREIESLLLVSDGTWSDKPEVVLGMVKELSRSEPPHRDQPPAWEKARDEVLRHPLLRLAPARNNFLTLLTEARCFTQIREDTRFCAAMPLPVMGKAFLEMGRRLNAIGVLETAGDIYHLTMVELESIDNIWPPPLNLISNLKVAVLRRKARRAELEKIPLIDPRLFRRIERDGKAILSGSAAGRGVAEGLVRIIRDASEFEKLQAGEVLVAPHTNPAWTPLFQRAAAVVVDTGGAASHAAIVAREYGIPAVMGAPDATKKLRDGQRVRVDGSSGKVYLIESGG